MTTRLKRWFKRCALAALLLAGLVLFLVESGLAGRWMRRVVIAQIERMTGGSVEVREFRFHAWTLRAELTDLTIHGRETSANPPFFHAEYVLLDVRVVSFFGRRIALDELRVDKPAVHVRVDHGGHSNFPLPQTPSATGKPLSQQLFDLAIRKFEVNQGVAFWNDQRVPLEVQGGAMHFVTAFDAPAPGRETYRGALDWKRLTLREGRLPPFHSDLSAKFALGHDRFDLEELSWKLPASELHLSATLASFARPDWTFRYHGRVGFEDIHILLRQEGMPGGEAEFTGEGEYTGGQAAAHGSYAAHNIVMPYRWFHTAGIESQGTYQVAGNRLVVPDFQASALGGGMAGRVEMEFAGLRFRAETHAQGMRLAQILAALDHPSFSVTPLHWDSLVAIDSVTTWEGAFRHLDIRGVTVWTPPADTSPGVIPASGHFDVHYSRDTAGADLPHGWISTPTSRVEVDGRLGADDSSLAAHITFSDLLLWDDFINHLRGRNATPRRIGGRGEWRGTMTGPLALAAFDGHFRVENAAYDQLFWDLAEGDLSYSHDHLRLTHARLRRGASTATLSLMLAQSDWEFRAESEWDLDVRLVHTDTDGLQSLFGTSYPARGTLSGEFRGHGTRDEPQLSSTFELEDLLLRRMHFAGARGSLEWNGAEVTLSLAEIRKGKGRASGSFHLVQAEEQTVSFDFQGGGFAVEDLEPLRNERLPLAGTLSFSLRGSGPLRAPQAEGTLELHRFGVGGEVLGDFNARLRSDGASLRIDATSAMGTGKLDGHMDIALAGNYPFQGELSVEDVDLDPFLQTALRLRALTGHSHVTGLFRVSGALGETGSINVEADVSQISLDYEYVKLHNVGPLRLSYRADEVRITSAHLEGPDTDLNLSGYARFARDRQLALQVAGRINLRLLAGLLPDLDARGAAEVNAGIAGTSLRPRITGRLRLENAAANYGDFPAGLSNVNGEFVFDASRMVFENVAAEAGGGSLLLGGSVSYGDGALRYDLNARATHVRIRYPEGMSWLAGGNLRLRGTSSGALLSGRVVVERLLMIEGLDLSSMMGKSNASTRGAGSTSGFLRNLQFEIEAVSSPGARVEWAAARFESEASLRIRGTAEHPILLGHVHLLSGELNFRGNRFQLSRGDMNFSNPFRLDPVIDLEATTNVQQYQISIQLSGAASRLALSYRSDPPLPSTDIITLLALGRTGEESSLRSSGSGAGTDLGAQALLSEAISSQVGGRIERLFGVSRFRVDPTFSGAEVGQNATARVTIEQRITRDLTVSYVTNVTSTQKQIFQFEYNVTRKISILALRDENGTFGLDIRFQKRFK
jgi:translocation and assembly module TamB